FLRLRFSLVIYYLFSVMLPRPPSSTLFPYTTLFRSVLGGGFVGPLGEEAVLVGQWTRRGCRAGDHRCSDRQQGAGQGDRGGHDRGGFRGDLGLTGRVLNGSRPLPGVGGSSRAIAGGFGGGVRAGTGRAGGQRQGGAGEERQSAAGAPAGSGSKSHDRKSFPQISTTGCIT